MKKPYTFLNLQKRLLCILCIITFTFLLVLFKLFFVSVVQSKNLQQKAMSQWTRDLSLNGLRGSFLDTNGNVLASSYTSYNVYVRPNSIKDLDYCVKTLSDVLQIDEQTLKEKIQSKKVSEVLIKQQIDFELCKKLLSFDIDGVYVSETSTRQYPYGDLLTSVLGFVTIDNVGQ